MKQILIVEDHAIVRLGIIRLLQDLLPMPVAIEEAATGAEALDRIASHPFDMVLLDLSLPGRNGLDLLKQLRRLHPKLPVLVLSMYPEEHYAVRALRGGAAGYLNKGSAAEELQAAAEKVLGGGRYITPSQADLLAEALVEEPQDAPLHRQLSDRECQFVSLLAAGRSTNEIANELSLSVKTISTVRSRVLEKLHLRSNAELIGYWVTQHPEE
ncbi:DNA-binding response regulator [Geomonas silvestris]|uniref:DNA-binding response regulator n=1 Tax=Geomonas silvestris TaxID=2740184 RepID=A0A6V8MDP4_9BACT|nr:response regulator transcription factor [Geomonas silvestris]GFO58087.1 DNA-binding response regulator [Geomonas silvestris]